MTTWVAWSSRGRGGYGESNPRAGVAHAAVRGVAGGDVRNGGFPLACGRWAPDGFDANINVSSGQRCRRCEDALARKALA